MNMTRIFRTAALTGACAALLTACASVPPPTAELAVSNAALAHAVSAGSDELAPQEMASARAKLDRAQAAMKDKKYENALALSNEAQVEIKLAEAKAQSAKARKASDAADEDARVLREEMARKAK